MCKGRACHYEENGTEVWEVENMIGEMEIITERLEEKIGEIPGK